MEATHALSTEAPARVLALILAADGSVSARAWRALDELDGFRQLGVTRDRFAELARDCHCRVDPGLGERSWLSDDDIVRTDPLLAAVSRPEQRRLVCQLAAAAIQDDGMVTHGARLVFERALTHWRIEPAALQPPAPR